MPEAFHTTMNSPDADIATLGSRPSPMAKAGPPGCPLASYRRPRMWSPSPSFPRQTTTKLPAPSMPTSVRESPGVPALTWIGSPSGCCASAGFERTASTTHEAAAHRLRLFMARSARNGAYASRRAAQQVLDLILDPLPGVLLLH